MPQRASSAETRAASCRSGVTSAAVLPGVSSASRKRERDRLRLRRRIGKLGQADAAQPPLGARQRLPFVREIGRRHRIGDRAARAPATRPRHPTMRQRCTSPRATPMRSSSSFRWNCGWVASPRPFSSGPSASHSSSGKTSASHKPGQNDHAFGHPRNARDERRNRRRRGGDAGGDGKPRRRLALPALGEPRGAAGCAARQGRSRPARRELPANVSKISSSFSSDFSQCGARSLALGDRIAQLARLDLLDQQRIQRPRKVGREPQVSPPSPRRARRSTPASAAARSGRSPAAAARPSIGSSAPPIRSSSSGSPIGISRGSSSPLPLARTNASVTARTARLLGSRMRPWASASGSLPKRAISPAASASANERWDWDGDRRRAAAARQTFSSAASVMLDRLGRADVEPQALVNRAEAAAFLDRPVPQDVGRERPFRRIREQPLGDHLDAGEDERRDMAALAAAKPARCGPCGSRPCPCG